MAEVNEKCAVAGVTASETDFPASELLRLGLFGLQHRGMEATGITSRSPGGSILAHRENGYVNDVYSPEVTRRLIGNVAIGHNRYSTSGSKKGHPQPVLDDGIGLAFAHNGNLPVTDILGPYLEKHNFRTQHMNDSEMMGHAIAHNLRKGQNLQEAITAAYPLYRGAFSCVAMHDGTIGVFRDQAGLRPLEVGEVEGGYAVASETRGLDLMGASHMFSVRPGELVILHPDGVEQFQVAEGQSKLDMFEIVYFASPDSYLYGQRVSEMRRRMGEQLAEQHPPFLDNRQNTLVVPVPDTSVPAAEGYADKLGLRHRQAIYRNRYNGGRSFMQPNQAERLRLNANKHTVINEAIKGLDIILIDDSIVRGNTLPRLISEVRAAGANSVSVLIASPPVRFPDYYGIDTPQQSELIAANLTVEQMQQKWELDYLGYLDLDRMIKATGLPFDMFNLSCFTGEYPIGIGRRKEEISTPVSMQGVE